MKRLALLLSLLLLIALPALADNRVFDDADLLSPSEETALNDTIAGIYATHHFDVVLHTTPSTFGKSVRMYAADYYDQGGFGYGAEGDGLIFVLSMAERDYYTVTTGSGIRIFTDYGIDRIGEDIVGYLSDGDYYGAMTRYLADVERFIVQATREEGDVSDDQPFRDYTPYDYDTPVTLRAPAERLAAVAPVILVAAFVIALIVVLIMRAGMKTARRKTSAGDYVVPGSLNLTRREDIYLYTTTVRTKIESNNSGGGRGGSSTFSGGGGRSHGGGGGKF